MASARPVHVYTLLDFSLAGFSVLEQHKGFFHRAQQVSAPIKTQRSQLLQQPAFILFKRLFVENVKFLKEAERFGYGASVSQGDATEKLAHQVAAQVAAAHRRVEEASGDPHEEEKDEAHKSSKGHVSEPAVGCPTSLETLEDRICSLDMEDKEEEDQCVGSLPQQRTIIQGSQNRVKQEDEPQRLRPPD
ncbi:hypothetical protein PBY51_019778 [Eleginops maclovinus]|uniref:Uncharacterized protein n=1 Tax=Eleginops maclovinus TaxID=56733 RepID=A0AAN8ASE8_ELEMC|nr:hypothetical protein PBY51_019778 [Eleginops maclovinus]